METTTGYEISMQQAINLYAELIQTVKHEEFQMLSLAIGFAQCAGQDMVQITGKVKECFDFFNDVGMI